MRKKLAILVLALAAAIPGASFAKGPNFSCPGGPPGHCKSSSSSHNNNTQQQQQQQQQQQSQSQCILVIAVLEPATC
jgi:hypothetical protein